MHRNRTRRESGLSFTEILIAFTIMAVTLVPVTTILSRMRRYQAKERNLINAIQLADQKLHEIATLLDYQDIVTPLDGTTVELTEQVIKGIPFAYELGVEETEFRLSVATPNINYSDWESGYEFFDFDEDRDIVRLPLTSVDEASFKKITLTVTWRDRAGRDEDRRCSLVTFKARLML